ncbi:MAG: MotA/TolQ/ExbB proton channel family protein [Bacteroidetes bacterium]|nr:MotA/TolQ/ExbB proton channel family protein [Bacteroidota bacterium]
MKTSSFSKLTKLALPVLMTALSSGALYAQDAAEEGASGTALFLQQFFNAFKWETEASMYMWIIALCAVTALALMLERIYFVFIRSNVDAAKFMAEIRKLVAGGNLKKAIALCETAKDKALPSVVLAGLKRAAEREGGPVDFRAIQNAVDEGTLEIIPKLSERAGYIAMLSNVSTLFGLMGTVYGLILSFAAVANPALPEDQKALLLARGISAAMLTTIWGLSVAIPCIIVYTMITTKTGKIIDEMDEHMVKLINLMTGNR